MMQNIDQPRSERSITTSRRADHLLFLDGLRAVAAIVVIWHHCWLQMYEHRTNWSYDPTYHYTKLLALGQYSVDLFIVLSGFCLALPVMRNAGRLKAGTVEFLKRRARRILPPYYMAMAVSLVLIWTLIGHRTGTHWDISLPAGPVAIFIHLLLLQDLAASGKINHVFWSIAVEWQIYFFFPVLLIFWRRIGAAKSTILATIISVVLYLFLSALGNTHHAFTRLLGLNFPYYALFTFGVFAAAIATSDSAEVIAIKQCVNWSFAFAVVTAIALIFDFVVGEQSLLEHVWMLHYLFGIWAATLLVTLTLAPQHPLHRMLAWRPLVFLGTFAYSIYLIHAPLIQVLWQYILVPLHTSPAEQFWGLVVVGTPLFVGAAYLFFLCCERPFLQTRPHSSMLSLEKDAVENPAP